MGYTFPKYYFLLKPFKAVVLNSNDHIPVTIHPIVMSANLKNNEDVSERYFLFPNSLVAHSRFFTGGLIVVIIPFQYIKELLPMIVIINDHKF